MTLSPSYPIKSFYRKRILDWTNKHTTNNPCGPPNAPDNNLGPEPIDLPAKRCLRQHLTQVNTPYIAYSPYHYWWGQELQYEGRGVFMSTGGKDVLSIYGG